jgi:hypothetical protein
VEFCGYWLKAPYAPAWVGLGVLSFYLTTMLVALC